uniref:Uncharacterized protein n=1 Tax=viral metagenome TaxID=1070528 RepID=A0A6C0JU32_9ZZZZ
MSTTIDHCEKIWQDVCKGKYVFPQDTYTFFFSQATHGFSNVLFKINQVNNDIRNWITTTIDKFVYTDTVGFCAFTTNMLKWTDIMGYAYAYISRISPDALVIKNIVSFHLVDLVTQNLTSLMKEPTDDLLTLLFSLKPFTSAEEWYVWKLSFILPDTRPDTKTIWT